MHIKRIQKELMEEIERLRRVEQNLIHEDERNEKITGRESRDKRRDDDRERNENGKTTGRKNMDKGRDSNRGGNEKGRDKVQGAIKREGDSNRGAGEKERLRCARKGNHYRYYYGNKYLNKSQMDIVRETANREYREKLLQTVQAKIGKLERLLQDMTYAWDEPERVYEKLHPARKQLVDPIIEPTEEYIKKWLEEPYDVWEIKDEDVSGEFYSQKGERVRSKSELIIADALARYGVPYKYEYPLKLKNGNGFITKRPDFVALNKTTLEMVVIEHLGMLDQERYYRNNIEKIDLYEKNGYLIGKNLILFHETSYSALNTGMVGKYIEQFLL